MYIGRTRQVRCSVGQGLSDPTIAIPYQTPESRGPVPGSKTLPKFYVNSQVQRNDAMFLQRTRYFGACSEYNQLLL